ncbi:MAG: hypothetical protein QXI09_03115, partial [Candidatus Aenigmatarchaeota archaeon]
NNDTIIIQKNWLKEMVKVAESDKKIGIIGCKLIYPDGRIQHAGIDTSRMMYIGYGESSKKYNKIKELESVTAACWLVREILFRLIGGFDEIYSPFCWEDIDYCIRVRRLGFKIYYVGKVAIIHKEGASVDKHSNELYYFTTRKNVMIVYFRYFGLIKKLKAIIKSFFQIFITKKNTNLKFSSSNILLHKKFLKRFYYFLKALIIALVFSPRFQNRRFY